MFTFHILFTISSFGDRKANRRYRPIVFYRVWFIVFGDRQPDIILNISCIGLFSEKIEIAVIIFEQCQVGKSKDSPPKFKLI